MTSSPAGRIEELVSELLEHDRLYYLEGKPRITDAEYDQLFRELRGLEAEHPELLLPRSPTQRVGAPLEDGESFQKVQHAVAMLSIESLFGREEVDEFVEKIERFLGLETTADLEWSVEPKFDGVSAALVYEQGKLVQAVTRGDGKVGEDVTSNLRTVRNVPLELTEGALPVPRVLEVRGELLIALERFERFNALRSERGQPTLANARNATAGAVRRNDPGEVARYPLEFHAYSAPRVEFEGAGPEFATHSELFAAIRAWGLPDSGHGRSVRGTDACVAYHDELEERRDSFPFEMDGIVAKLERFDLRQRLGSTARATRWQYAHKFAAREATSTLRAIEAQVGANGRLTPRAHVEPVEVAGVTVRHATLHNADHVSGLGLTVGDRVFLRRAGDVIPQITGVAESARGKAPKGWAASLPESLAEEGGGARAGVFHEWRQSFAIPEACPACGAEVVVEGKYARCTNTYACRPQLVGRALLLTGRGGFEIDSIGEKMVVQLVEAGMLETPADLFHLDPERLVSLERWGQKTVDNLMAQLDERRKVPFDRFLSSLAIPDVGGTTAGLLARHYAGFDELRAATVEDLVVIDGIGEVVAERIVEWFAREESAAFLQRLFDGGVELIYPEQVAAGGAFDGKTVVFTGTLEKMSRAEAKRAVETRGGKVTSSVSAKTDILVVGGKPGSKAKKAQALGVEVLLEADFLAGLDAPEA